MTTLIIITIASLLLSGLFSGTEIAFVTSDRVRVEIDVKKGNIISRILDCFYKRSELFISTLLVGNNIAVVIYGIAAAKLVEPWLQHFTDSTFVVLLLQTIISTTVILLAGEFIPKSTFKINPNTSMKLAAIPMWVLYVILYPISLFTSWLSHTLMKLVGITPKNDTMRVLSVGDLNEYLERTIDESIEDKKQLDNEVKMFHNALDFSSIHLRDCMIPRNELVAVDIDNTTRQQLSSLFTTSGRSKILVYREDIDNVLGYIHVSELFDPQIDWKNKLKPVVFAPETLLADKMMRRLLSEKRSLAVVIDEFGGTAGLVTLEDLVEEIFGDIQDEHDKSQITAKEVAPGVYEFSGRAEVSDINEQFHLDIPEDEEYQTLAGYILHTTGQIPEQGVKILLDNMEFEVMKRTATRLELIRLTMLADEN